jgi:hypothetical protein
MEASNSNNPENLDRGDVEVETQQVVEFHELGETNEEVVSSPTAPQEYLRSAQDDLTNSVIGFLSRPIQLARFQWQTGLPSFTQLKVIQLPHDWIGNNMIKEKLLGFRYVRATFKIRVQVNAQPFNAGRLIIYFVPLGNAVNRTSAESHFGGVTGYPHVDLDLGVNTLAELTIPFAINVTHTDLFTGLGNLGSVYVSVYSPLTGSAEADGTVWLTASDIDIQQPTGVGIIAQEQMAGGAVLTKEVKKAGRGAGPLEKTASVVSGVAGALGAVPVIGGIATTVGWVADAISGAASIFGWSKPTVQVDATPIVAKYAQNMANYNGVENAKVLAFDSRNSVRNPDHLRRDNVDEMTIAHLTAMPTYLDRFTITAAKPQGGLLWFFPVHPCATKKNVEVTILPPRTTRYSLNTMLSFVSNTAQLWRGTLVYHFKLVKTRFHSGRIRIAYIPGVDETYNFSTVEMNKVYSKIYDFMDTTEVDFEVPFVWNNPWATTDDLTNGITNRLCTNVPTGVITVDVVNALRAPTTAADNFEILVEVSAGSDFELAVPKINPTLIYYLYRSPLMTKAEEKSMVLSLNPSGSDLVWYKKQKASRQSGLSRRLFGETPAGTEAKPGDSPPLEVSEPAPNSRVGWTTEQRKEISQRLGKNILYLERKALSQKESWPLYNGPLDFDAHLSGGDIRSINHVFSEHQKQVLWDRVKDRLPLTGDPQAYRDAFDTWYMSTQDAVPITPSVPRAKEQMANDFIRNDTMTMMPTELGIGEKYVSLRQLLKRKTRFRQTVGAAGTNSAWLFPYGSNWQMNSNLSIAYDSPFEYVMSLYRWMSGGLHIMFASPKGAAPTNAPSYIQLQPGFTSTQALPFNSIGSAVPLQPTIYGEAHDVFFTETEKVPTIHVPFYQPYPAIPTGLGAPPVVDYDRSLGLLGSVPSNYGTQLEVVASENLSVYRSVADDFSFMFVTGPPLTYNTTLPFEPNVKLEGIFGGDPSPAGTDSRRESVAE